MSDQALEQELDPTPLVVTLTEKSKARKLKWQATADEHAFIASVGGDTTLEITLEKVEGWDDHGNRIWTDQPVLHVLDAKGRTLSEIHSSQVKDVFGLWPLYKLAQRIGNKLDERMTALMEVLQKL